MKVGIDTFSISGLKLDEFGQLEWIKKHGFAGAQFGCLGTDVKKLKEIRSHADSLGLYSHVSINSPNRHLGSASHDEVVARIGREVEAAAECGWREFHSTLGADGNRYRHSSVSWEKQVQDSVHVLTGLRPVLAERHCRVNLEPHFDATTFELVEIAERVGPDICGICLDTANVMLFGEHPVEAAKRAAPYTHLTHIKDAILFFSDKGLMRQTFPPGRGALDWEKVLAALFEYEPDLPLSIEDHKWLFGAEIFEEWWHREQRHLSRCELAMTVGIAWREQQRINRGERPDPYEYEKIPHLDELEERLHSGRDYLNNVINKIVGRTSKR
jgi:sugar phosphate isomerase/epimerase